MTYKKKLIEVALPLDAINKASVRESFIYRGNPSALHKWWAQRPLAAARAVIFSQMVDDPSTYVDDLLADGRLRRKAERVFKARRKLWQERAEVAKKAREFDMEAPDPGPEPTLEDVIAEQERERLFKIIEDLVQWESTTNETVLQAARDEIWQSWRRTCAQNADRPDLFNRHKLPTFHDPFAGGGTLPLEAQRLGLNSRATDLNPIAVLINKAMIEIPPRFARKPPVNPVSRQNSKGLFEREWRGARGLAEDIRHYGKWIRDEAEKRIGHLYPKVRVTEELAEGRLDLRPMVGKELTVIAWLWARTVKSPNPAFGNTHVPLASTFMLSTKPGREAFVEPVVSQGEYHFVVRVSKSDACRGTKNGTKLSRGGNFKCLMSDTPITPSYIRAEGMSGRIGARMLAMVAEGERGRVYLPPSSTMEAVACKASPAWKPEGALVEDARAFTPTLYGLCQWSDLFTDRQLVALTMFYDLVSEARSQIEADAVVAGYARDSIPLDTNGSGATSYADAVATYLTLSLSKVADYNCALVPWYTKEDRPGHLFSRQAVPMVWDYAELNPLSNIGGALGSSIKIVADALDGCWAEGAPGETGQADVLSLLANESVVISTDPPYYDNVPYADLSDFFYSLSRRTLKTIFPTLFATLAVPKSEELVASTYRHGGKLGAEAFFLEGMTQAMHRLSQVAHPVFPVTIYYAFKQSEKESGASLDGTASTGWETFLDAVIRAGFAMTGTWPMRTERESRSRGIGSNALASSIVLVCRKRAREAPTATRREFLSALRTELPQGLAHLQRGNIAPVDLAQAAIGPGMAVYTRYSKVVHADGKSLTVREALALINQTLDEVLASQEGDFDADSRWALAWFEQSAFDEGEYGVAETLSKAKNTSVSGLVQAGILTSKSGKVRLLRPEELPPDWDPTTDPRLTTWEMVHHLIRALESGGESAAAALVAKLGTRAETARELCYRLYTICERKKRAAEALSYNALVQSWPEIARLAREGGPTVEQGELFGATP